MKKIKLYVTKYFNLIVGLLLVSIAFNLFISPNDLAAGGVSGLSIVINRLFGINMSLFMLIGNIILLVISYICLGKNQTKKTVIGSILFPILINVTSGVTKVFNIDEAELIVKVLFGGIMSGYGYGLVFKSGFTSGGTDIIDQLVTKYYKVSMSTSILLVDGLIVLTGGLVFGIEKMIYTSITLLLISVYSNKSMIGMNNYKTFYISTCKIDEIKEFLIEKYDYNVTILDVKGGYTNKKSKMIMCVIRTIDYYEIEMALKIIDKNMFVTISNSYEAINHGKKQ